tara:strand:- start:21280 stop:21921 length:642 start_codon:yes stop_codon:yes gene_type:complete
MKIKFKKYWRKTSLKKKEDAYFLLNHISKFKPKNFLEIGIFHGVTARNVCELLYLIHKENFSFTGIDIFFSEDEVLRDEIIPKNTFSNPIKRFYHKYINKLNPYSLESVLKLLKKFEKNIEIIKGDSNEVLKKINLNEVDYVFLDGGHKYQTVKNDLEILKKVIINNGVILCDDYNLSYAPGVKKAIDEYILTTQFNLKILNTRFAQITKFKL